MIINDYRLLRLEFLRIPDKDPEVIRIENDIYHNIGALSDKGLNVFNVGLEAKEMMKNELKNAISYNQVAKICVANYGFLLKGSKVTEMDAFYLTFTTLKMAHEELYDITPFDLNNISEQMIKELEERLG